MSGESDGGSSGPNPLKACRPTASFRGALGAVPSIGSSSERSGPWVQGQCCRGTGRGTLWAGTRRWGHGCRPTSRWTPAPPPKAAPPRALGLVRCCCCSEILNRPAHLSALSPRLSRSQCPEAPRRAARPASLRSAAGVCPVPRLGRAPLPAPPVHMGSVLFLVWAVLLCRLLLSVLPFVFRFLVRFLDLGEVGVSWASPLPGC